MTPQLPSEDDACTTTPADALFPPSRAGARLSIKHRLAGRALPVFCYVSGAPTPCHTRKKILDTTTPWSCIANAAESTASVQLHRGRSTPRYEHLEVV
ncbi:hypothetical protein MRX96_056130 [Rhipicephalus microplus]